MKRIGKILILTVIATVVVFFLENVTDKKTLSVTRKSYGEGEKVEEYEVEVEGETEHHNVQVEVGELQYTESEVEQLFEDVMHTLDAVVLGENESFDCVTYDLNLVTELEEYPVFLQWDLDSYEVMGIDGTIREDQVSKDGTLVQLRGTISYYDAQTVYVRNLLVCEPVREGSEKLRYDIQQEVQKREKETKEEAEFSLPQEVDGKALSWSQKQEKHWYYVLLIGVASSVYLVYREKEQKKQKARQRREELLREYPGMISKFTMLLGTGTTVRGAWEKIVQNYEQQKIQMGKKEVYEEMAKTYREIQGGIAEAEAYEKFGKHCEVMAYVKFGAMLSQNLRKGSKGISEILRMEAIQSFETRKSTAKRLGEEAGTKLLAPMLGMLFVVLIMVMVPALLTMQL